MLYPSVTMGIRNMAWNEWIELDQNFVAHHRLREHRIRHRGERVVKVNETQPGIVAGGHDAGAHTSVFKLYKYSSSGIAARELVYELVEYLSRRYPEVYRVTRKAAGEKGAYSWYGEGQIQTVTVVPLQRTYNIEEEEPMTLSALM